MFEIKTTTYFDDWLDGLKDGLGAKCIKARIRNAESGNFGKGRQNIAEGISEMKIDQGPGYWIYYCKRGGTV
jgi:putative addiction module killer protein